MTKSNTNLYETLGVGTTATIEELKAAHRRLSFTIMSGKSGLSREECEFQLQLLDVALNTLSDPCSRDIYDMRLAAENLSSTPTEAQTTTAKGLVRTSEESARIAEAVQNVHLANASTSAEHRYQLDAVSHTLNTSLRSAKIALRIAIWMIVLGVVIRMAGCIQGARTMVLPPGAVARGEDKLIVQDYFKKHGVRVANRAEVAALEAESQRKANEKGMLELDQRAAEDEAHRAFDEARQAAYKEQREIERAKEEARYEAQRREREAQRNSSSDE